MTLRNYLADIASQLVHELEPILEIKAVTTNTDLLGSYAEAVVRRLALRVVHPMRVSKGAVLDYPMPAKLTQIDVIVWAPFPAPGIFETADFALVPRSSAFGVLEIKRSGYTGVDEALERFISLVPSVVAAPNPKINGDSRLAGMGVVGVLEDSPSARLTALLSTGNAVAIFDVQGAKASVRSADVLKLVNFLHFVGWRYRMQAAQPEYPQLVVS